MSNLFQTIAAILAALAMLDSNAACAQSAAKQPLQLEAKILLGDVRGPDLRLSALFLENHAAQREASHILPR